MFKNSSSGLKASLFLDDPQVGLTPGQTPSGSTSGRTPGQTPVRDKLAINPEDSIDGFDNSMSRR
jgi:hypothetical protein